MLSFNIYKIILWKLALDEMLNSAHTIGSDIRFGGGWIQIQRISVGV